ncbi:MAG: ABC transporter substrate-binding protein, partial [Candidatus Dadabacteria bacterium]
MTLLKHNKPLILSLILLVIIIAFFSFSRKKQRDEVTIGYSALRISLPVFVAWEQGYFLEEGLNVNLVRFDTAQPLMNSLVAGSLQAGGYTALPITYNAMLRSKTDLYFVTAMIEDQKHRISYLIVPRDTPQTFTIQDLKGKKIGILPTVAYRAWLEEILRENGVDPSEVEIVQIAPALSPSALQSGQVDALFTNDPAATTVLQQGIGRLLNGTVEVPKYLGEPFLFGSFNIRRDFADSNPEKTKKIIRALNKAVEFVNKNPSKAKQMMKKYLHKSQ